MSSSNPALSSRETSPPASIAPEAIQRQLERILCSSQFRSSRRCQLLLKYVTEHTLSGDAPVFKERTLGMAVFGREPCYDTTQDPIVRTTAGEIRKKLAQYYQEPDHATEIKIELQPGSYVPGFRASAPGPVPAAPPPSTFALRKRSQTLIAVGVVVLLLLAGAALSFSKMNSSALDQFWSRMLDAPGGVLFCLGEPDVLNLRSDRQQSALVEALEHSSKDQLSTSNQAIPLTNLVAIPGRYVDYGDTVCLVRLTSFLERHRQQFHIRGTSSTTFADLREHPTVFIGAFDNDWTLRSVGQVRYVFEKSYEDPAHVIEIIRDRDHPEKNDWKLVNSWPDWNVPYDYAVISRIVDRNTDRMIMVAAGITEYGTLAAGEVLTNPDYFNEIAQQLPPGWQQKNVQIVLKVPVVRGASGHPHAVATYAW